MAKGNMLQGMARGKVGDVVFSRLNGEQISRVRNRHPKNPRSNAQLYQRAIMATVMQAYSAGKVIFDHAFQGKAVGAENQRRFMTLNAKLLRSQIAADIDGSVAAASQVGRVVAPGVATPVPFGMVISEGSYPQSFYTTEIEDPTAGVSAMAPNVLENEKVNDYCERNGLIPGDIYTFVIMKVDTSNNRTPVYSMQDAQNDHQKVFNCEFSWVRLTVKADVLTNDNALDTTAKLNASPLFDIETSLNYPTADINTKSATGTGRWTTGIGGVGVIRSRKDQDLRSTANMIVDFGNDTYSFGLASSYIIDAWKQGTAALGDSDLILEGGNE